MAIQVNITYSGIEIQGAYVGISKTRTQKIYQRDEGGNIVGEHHMTWAYLDVATNLDKWVNGVTINQNHCISLNGDLTYTECRDGILLFAQSTPFNIGDVVVDWSTAVAI